jgi:hypothetical protein
MQDLARCVRRLDEGRQQLEGRTPGARSPPRSSRSRLLGINGWAPHTNGLQRRDDAVRASFKVPTFDLIFYPRRPLFRLSDFDMNVNMVANPGRFSPHQAVTAPRQWSAVASMAAWLLTPPQISWCRAAQRRSRSCACGQSEVSSQAVRTWVRRSVRGAPQRTVCTPHHLQKKNTIYDHRKERNWRVTPGWR